MRQRKTMIFGLLCGLGCALCVGLYLYGITEESERSRAEALAKYGGDQLEVFVARRTLAAGETLDESSVEKKLWVVDLLPEGAILDASGVMGKQIGTPILQGEVISELRFNRSEYHVDVPEGFTALSLPAQDVQAVGGALSPGLYVDVYATGPSSSTRLLEGSLVLATSLDKASSLGSSSSSWITLAVPPESVAELVAASQNLELSYVLPNPGEKKA